MTQDVVSGPMTRDRSTALSVVGFLQIGLGLLCGLLVPFAFVPLIPAVRKQIEAQGGTADLRNVFLGAAMYGCVSIFFLWTGIGAIRKKRWVRPLMLCISWMWLAAGALGSVMVAFILPGVMKTTLRNTPGATEGLAGVIAVVTLVFVTMIYIAIPACLVLFYKSENVKATLEARDPQPAWTDRVPIPVLGLTIGLGLIALFTLPSVTYGTFPFFTTLFTGTPGRFCILLFAATYAYLARAAWRREPIAWWGTIVVASILSLSAIVFVTFGDPSEYLSALGVRGDQAEMVAGIFSGAALPLAMLLFLAVMIGFLIWVRRFFPSRTAGAAGPRQET